MQDPEEALLHPPLTLSDRLRFVKIVEIADGHQSIWWPCIEFPGREEMLFSLNDIVASFKEEEGQRTVKNTVDLEYLAVPAPLGFERVLFLLGGGVATTATPNQKRTIYGNHH